MSYDLRADKLIVIEGPDKTGKSTAFDKLVESGFLGIQQPSNRNDFGWLRSVVKDGERGIDPFARQLLHTISHLEDYESLLTQHNGNIVMDRCYVSTLVYSGLTGVSYENRKLLQRIHEVKYRNLRTYFKDVELHLFLHDPYTSERGEKDAYRGISHQELADNYEAVGDYFGRYTESGNQAEMFTKVFKYKNRETSKDEFFKNVLG